MPYSTKGKLQSLLDNLKTPNNNVILVDSNIGSDDYSGIDSWDNALATLDAAIAKCVANNGDKIIIAPGHAENYTTTGTKVAFDVAGVEIIGLGIGASKPTFTFAHVGATMVMSAASNKLTGVKFVTNIDLVTTYLTVTGADCLVDVETADATNKEVITDITVSGARPDIRVKKHGYVDGDANARVVSLDGVVNGKVDVYAITKVTTAIVNFVSNASTNVEIRGLFYVKGTTDFTKNVVDTITGSVFSVNGFDMSAGAAFSGNTSTPQADDTGAIIGTVNSYTKVEADADMSYTKVRSDLDQSYTKWANNITKKVV